MNELEDRLTSLLTRVADGVDVRPDLDAVVDDRTVTAVVEPSASAGRRRTAAVLVAAAVVLAVVIGVLGGIDRDRATTSATPAPSAEAFPVLDPMPERFAGSEIGVVFPPERAAQPGARALVGRRVGDTFTDVVAIDAYRRRPTMFAGMAGEEVADGPMGVPATRYVEAGITALVVRTSPVLVLTGRDPEALFRATPITVAGSDRPGVEMELLVGGLPAGYETIVPAGPPGPTLRRPTLSTGRDGDVLSVQVSRDAMNGLLTGLLSDMRSVTVGGHAGWLVEHDGQVLVSWSPDGAHTVLLQTTRPAQEALAAAARVRLVDERTWRRTYAMADEAGTGQQTPTTAVTATTAQGRAR